LLDASAIGADVGRDANALQDAISGHDV
jgi:hypothetical protein